MNRTFEPHSAEWNDAVTEGVKRAKFLRTLMNDPSKVTREVLASDFFFTQDHICPRHLQQFTTDVINVLDGVS